MERPRENPATVDSGLVRPALDALAIWPAVAALALHGAAFLLWGLFRMEDATGWHTCFIDTCEGNHIGSPVLLILIMAWAGAMFLSLLCGAIAVWVLAAAATRRTFPAGQSMLSVALCFLAFAVDVVQWMWAGQRSLAEAVAELSTTAFSLTIWYSVTSGLSFLAVGYAGVVTVRRRALARLPTTAFFFGVSTFSYYLWWWNFTDRTF